MTKNTTSEFVECQNNVNRGVHLDIGSILIETPWQQSRPVKWSEHSSNSYDGWFRQTQKFDQLRYYTKKSKTFATNVVLKFICLMSRQRRMSHTPVRAKVSYLSWLERQLVHQFDYFSANKLCPPNWLDLKLLWSWKWASKSSSRSGSGSSSLDHQSLLAMSWKISLCIKVGTILD